MFELADSGSSGDLPLLCSPLLLSPALSSPPSLSFFYLSTCYATLCHAALAQVCGHVLRSRNRAHHLRRLHLRPFSSSSTPDQNDPSFLPSFLPAFLLSSSFSSVRFLLFSIHSKLASRSRSYPASRISLEDRGTERSCRRPEALSLLVSPFPVAPWLTYLYLAAVYTPVSAGACCHAQWLRTRGRAPPANATRVAPLLFTDPGTGSARQVTPPPFPLFPCPCLEPDTREKDRPIAVAAATNVHERRRRTMEKGVTWRTVEGCYYCLGSRVRDTMTRLRCSTRDNVTFGLVETFLLKLDSFFNSETRFDRSCIGVNSLMINDADVANLSLTVRVD